MNKIRIYGLLLATGAFVVSLVQANSNKQLSSLQGQWFVEQVLVDQNSDNGLPAQYYMPKYQGRVFDISASSFMINKPADEECQKPSLVTKQLTLSELIKNSIHSRAYAKNNVSIADMQLNLQEQILDVNYLYCDNKPRVKDYGMPAEQDLSNLVWLVKIDEQQIMMSWHDQTILILSPLSPEQKVTASFNCKKAQTDSELAICKDWALAAFDKSVANAYDNNISYYQTQADAENLLSSLKIEQRKWLTNRERCGVEQLCLRTAMDTRIDDLIYDLAELMYERR